MLFDENVHGAMEQTFMFLSAANSAQEVKSRRQLSGHTVDPDEIVYYIIKTSLIVCMGSAE